MVHSNQKIVGKRNKIMGFRRKHCFDTNIEFDLNKRGAHFTFFLIFLFVSKRLERTAGENFIKNWFFPNYRCSKSHFWFVHSSSIIKHPHATFTFFNFEIFKYTFSNVSHRKLWKVQFSYPRHAITIRHNLLERNKIIVLTE